MPADFPATVLYEFRRASLITQLALWGSSEWSWPNCCTGCNVLPISRSPSPTTPSSRSDVISPPSPGVYAEARRRLDALAKPVGALGRLEDLAAWVAACQGACPPRPLDRVRAVILAGDHGVSLDGVSAYPREVTPVMVRAFAAGVAGANCLARQHGVALRVLDLGVDDDLEDVPAEVSAYHLGPSQPIDQADALTADDCRQALRAGEAIAEVEIAAGADLLIIGDMGIGNTTPAAALVAATFGLRSRRGRRAWHRHRRRSAATQDPGDRDGAGSDR